MTRSLYRALVALALLLAWPPAAVRGGAAAAPDDALTVDRYVAIVRRAHPAAARATALAGAAAAERSAARLLPDPVFEVTLGNGRTKDAPGGRAAAAGFGEKSIAVAQTVPWPGARSASVRAADAAARALEAGGDEALWALEVDARRAFDALLLARTTVEVARAAEEDARSLHDLVARRADLGESREVDRLKARVEWLRERRLLRTAERQAEAAEAVVRLLAVEALPHPLAVTGALPAPIAKLDVAALGARLAQVSPRLKRARAEADGRAALAGAARRARVPDVDLTVFRADEVDRLATGVTLGVRVPLWNANRGAIARAASAAALVRAEAEGERIAARRDLATRARDAEAASEQLAGLRDEVLPAAREGLRLARLLYEAGETSLLELLDARRTCRDAELEAARASFDLAVAVGELRGLLGPDYDPWKEAR